MVSWKAPLDVVEFALFVGVYEDVAVDRLPYSRSPDLVWLEHSVSVREDDWLPEAA
jgi:hypothetical protein